MWILSILFILFAAWLGHIQANYNELPENVEKRRKKQEEKRRKKRSNENEIEMDAFRKYPGIGGQYLKRQAYIEKRMREI